jgi:hypothetical protein
MNEHQHSVTVTRVDIPFTNILEIVFKFTLASILISALLVFVPLIGMMLL